MFFVVLIFVSLTNDIAVEYKDIFINKDAKNFPYAELIREENISIFFDYT